MKAPQRPGFLPRTAAWLECLSEFSGRLVAWLVLLLVVLISYDVAMRYLFEAGSVALQELEWHLFALIFLLGAAYTFKHDGHVRVDVFYQNRMGIRARAWVDLLGTFCFLIPFCALVIINSWPFVHDAWLFHEASPDPGGLPARWLLKAAIPLGFVLLLLQGLADAINKLLILMNKD